MYTTLHAKAVTVVPAVPICITTASTREPVRCMHTASRPTAPEKAWITKSTRKSVDVAIDVPDSFQSIKVVSR
jgi:hypothetical protein